MSKKLLNSPQAAVNDMLEGLVQTVPHLRRLDGFPDVSSAETLMRDRHWNGTAMHVFYARTCHLEQCPYEHVTVLKFA